jgi:hypothetical protein
MLATIQSFSPEPSVFLSAVEKYTRLILPVVPYGCETWSLTLRKEHRQRMFVNRVLRSVFGLKWDEVKGGWRNLHNEELRDLYSSRIINSIIKLRRRLAGGIWQKWG